MSYAATFNAADEQILLQRSLAGDHEAFDRLIHRYQRMVYVFAMRLSRDRDEAEDIASEAMIRAHRSLDSFRGSAAFSTWLCRIVTNCHLDRKKRASRRPTVSLDAPYTDEFCPRREQIVSTAASPLEEATRERAVQRLLAAMDRLPENQRDLIVMFHVRGMAYEEIAAQIGVPLGTVKSRLNRARLAVRDHLAVDAELFA
ncbi:MAG: sigma-70 family RNA polymerase sigma factor [Fimbriimonas sp.]